MIGRRVRALDWADRTLGRVNYTADLTEPAHLHAAILRSPIPHGRITHLDVTRAARMPGVRAIVTSADFAPGITYVHRGGHMSDRPPLADGVVRFAGQEIAAVAAETVDQARRAVAAIDLRILPRRAPLTVREARRPRARALHERPAGRNVAARWNSSWGAPEEGIAAATVTVEGDFVYPSVAPACMEPNTTLARWDAGRKVLELWTSTHSPYFVAKEVAHLLGIEQDRVICREVATGGSFGSKSKACEHEVLAAALARKAGRPVLLALTREEEFAANKPRHRFETHLRTHAGGDGRLRAFETEINVDNGAYSHIGAAVMKVGVIALGSLYQADGVRFDARLVDTATQPGGQYRGYGTPRLAACLETVRTELNWDAKRAGKTPGRGLGVACATHGSGAYAYEMANISEVGVDVFDDGRVRVRFGGSDTGTGQKTILAQIAARELGVPLDRVDVLSMDGELTPLDLGGWASRATHMSGTATGRAATEVAGRLRGLAAAKLGCAAGEVELRDGAARHGEFSVTIADLVRANGDGALSLDYRYELEGAEPMAPGKDRANLSPTYSFAAHGTEVEVDRRTGKVTILDYAAAHDVGIAINPTMVESQIIGGTVHAAIDGHRCQAVTPSDLATVLIALDTIVQIADGTRTRQLPLADLYTGPGETRLGTSEMLITITIPAVAIDRACVFTKLALWEGDFAVASVAVSTHADARRWDDPRIVLGALAPVPWRARETERALDGTPLEPDTSARVRSLLDSELTRHAHPLPNNGWKLDAAARLTETAVRRIIHTRDAGVPR